MSDTGEDLVLMDICLPTKDDDDASEAMFSTGIQLPTYTDASDAKVLGAVKQVFKDFAYDAKNDASKQFRDIDDLADFVKGAIDEMNSAKQIGDRTEVARNGAILARFWYMAERLDSALSSGKYGQGVGNQLASKMGLALSTIYSIRSVAKNLTPSDCWLLGTRGCHQTHLRKLASLPDAGLRKSIIDAFLKSVANTADADAMEHARKMLTAACNKGCRDDFAEAATTDPTTLESDDLLSEEYVTGFNNLKALEKMLRPLANNDKFVDIRDSLGQIFVSVNTPDAQEKVDAVVTLANKILDLMHYVAPNLKDLTAETQSLAAGLTVTDSEGNPVIDK